MSRSQQRSTHEDVALQRLTALTERLSIAPSSDPSRSAVSGSAADPSPDPPIIASIPVPPYAQDPASEPTVCSLSGGSASGGPSTEQSPSDGVSPGPSSRTRDHEDVTSGDSGTGGKAGPDPRLRPPPGYVEVGADLTRRSWLAALRERLPPSLTEQPHLSRSGLHALVAVCSVAVIAATWFLIQARPSPEPAPEPDSASGDPASDPAPSGAGPSSPGASPGSPQPTGDVLVHVDGKVEDPGVFTLPAGSRVADAVEAAGGVDSGIDTDSLNLARPLVDGEQILVGVTPPPGATDAGAPAPGNAPDEPEPLVDLNSASPQQLEELPGVGPVLAERIVEYRTTNGGFASVEQLNDVSGIGEVRYAELSELVQVSGTS